MTPWMVRGALILSAAAAAILPLPAAAVEKWYSAGLYPRVQAIVTPLSNRIAIAIFDIAALIFLAGLAALFVRRARARGLRAAVLQGVRSILVATAVIYLIFFAMWGLNYRRIPLEDKLDYEPSRITRDAALRLARDAVRMVNAGYAAAHAEPADDEALKRSFAEAEQLMGASRRTVPGVPKASLLGIYFRHAAISGMTIPFFLEITLSPELLPFERPHVLAHEWAHLAGYADESEANFLAWLTCARGDAAAQYSGWLETYQFVVSSLGRADRKALPPLDAGPRADLQAMRERYARSSPIVREAARDAYDSYLRANRVSEGIESYGSVLRLMLGSRHDEGWTPRLRSRP